MDAIPEFGIKRENEERRDGGCGVVFDPATQRYAVGSPDRLGAYMLFSGGIDEGEDIQTCVTREVTEESGLHRFKHVEKIGEALTHYFNSRKGIYRLAHATCFLIILESTDLVPQQLEESEDFELVWKTAEEILANWDICNQNEDYSHWIYLFKKAVARAKELGYDTESVLP